MDKAWKKYLFVVLILLVGGYFFVKLRQQNGTNDESSSNPRNGSPNNSSLDNQGGQSGATNGGGLVPGGQQNMDARVKAMQIEANKRQQRLFEQDKLVLADSKAEFPQFSFALMRLSTARDPVARKKALELINDKDSKKSMIAYRALGYFDEADVNEKLEEVVNGKDAEAAKNALHSLTWNPQPGSGREEILKNYLKDQKLNFSDEATLNHQSFGTIGALYKMSKNPDEQEKYFDQVLEFSRSKSANEMLKMQAAQTLMQMNPGNAEGQKLMKEIQENREKKIQQMKNEQLGRPLPPPRPKPAPRPK
jgi:hypothetical protein